MGHCFVNVQAHLPMQLDRLLRSVVMKEQLLQ
jgi:hypothetical protein